MPVCQGVRAFWLLPVGWMPIRSQTRRDTNFAIPGYLLFCHDTTANGKNKVISVCGHLCGQDHFCAVFGNRGKSRKRRCCKALRRFASPYPGYRHGTPKPRALPSELHPVMKLGSGAGPEICGIIITDMAGKSKGKIRGENFQPPGGLPRSGMVGYNGRKELNKGVSR